MEMFKSIFYHFNAKIFERFKSPLRDRFDIIILQNNIFVFIFWFCRFSAVQRRKKIGRHGNYPTFGSGNVTGT